ncbi:MAG: RluA family pseudouridine synthase [Verrucomicrobiota bacterium]
MSGITLSAKPEDLPLGVGVRLLLANEDGLVALEKPIKVLSHPNSEKDISRSLLEAEYDYEGEFFHWNRSGTSQRAWLVNRLDSGTSGVILLTLNEALSQEMKRQFATHMVSKTYYAIVKGTPSKPTGNWNDTLQKDVYRANRLVKGGQRVPAKARYQVNKIPTGGFPVSLLKLMPVTGRTHQLRVQCKKHGHPIVGDTTYGSFSFNREVEDTSGVGRMLLHAAETHVKYAYQGKHREFHASSPLPEAFNEVLRYRPGLLKTQLASQQPTKVSPKLAQRRFRH